MTWIYQGREILDADIEGYQAFCYIITRLDTGRSYIGKKRLIKKTSKPPLKGKKRKRVTYGSSDWREYFGSSDELLADIEKTGKDNFRREILFLAKGLGDSSFVELYFQLLTWSISSKNWYNGWVSARIRTSHVAKLDRTSVENGYKRILDIMKEFHHDDLVCVGSPPVSQEHSEVQGRQR
jgi:hypothetical protein